MQQQPPNLRLDIVVPVYNESATLARCVRELHAYLSTTSLGPWRITIADNASTDQTPQVSADLTNELEGVVALRLEEKGRGRALKRAWSESSAEVLVYVDEDLSTGLNALGPLVAPLLSGHSDLAIGTRLARASRVIRGGRREFISRSYNLLLRSTLCVGFSDAQCGFKAIRREAAQRLLPLVEDDAWFFDTELLIIAEHAGLRIHEVPVDWVDDLDSSVHITSTALADLRGMARVGSNIARGRLPLAEVRCELGRAPYATATNTLGRLLRFCAVGIASTALYALLYLFFQQGLAAQDANLAALLLSAIANTSANRVFTFRVRGAGGLLHQFKGLVAFGIAWAITSSSLAVLHAHDPAASATTSLTVLTIANLVATVVRYCLFSRWIFRSKHDREHSPAPIMPGISHPALGQKVSTR